MWTREVQWESVRTFMRSCEVWPVMEYSRTLHGVTQTIGVNRSGEGRAMMLEYLI